MVTSVDVTYFRLYWIDAEASCFLFRKYEGWNEKCLKKSTNASKPFKHVKRFRWEHWL